MTIVGWVLAIIGFGPLILDWMGMLAQIPVLNRFHAPMAVWAAIGIVGIIIAMMFRRPRN